MDERTKIFSDIGSEKDFTTEVHRIAAERNSLPRQLCGRMQHARLCSGAYSEHKNKKYHIKSKNLVQAVNSLGYGGMEFYEFNTYYMKHLFAL
jgi:hypothetical protein